MPRKEEIKVKKPRRITREKLDLKSSGWRMPPWVIDAVAEVARQRRIAINTMAINLVVEGLDRLGFHAPISNDDERNHGQQ